MPNFKLTIEYDGTAYCGWQRQKKDPTVQETIERALAAMLRRPVHLNGSGRTDAGVHALGQVANFRADTRLGPEVFQKGLNSLLPDDIVIRACQTVSDSFHARYDARRKTYRYHILNRRLRAAVGRQYAWHVHAPLNLDRMRKAARTVVGTHDFKGFEGAGSPRLSTVRTVFQAEMQRSQADRLELTLTGDGFLRHMVRNIAGTLVEIGREQRTETDMAAILAEGDRRQAGVTAPAHGLFLVAVDYGASPPS